MAELVEHEQVNGGRDPAAAAGDHRPVTAGSQTTMEGRPERVDHECPGIRGRGEHGAVLASKPPGG
jgi:hypothetical protein